MAHDKPQEPLQTSLLDKKKKDSPRDGEDIALRRVFGIPGATAMIFGNIIGSGIFISARWVLVYSGSVGLALCIWLLCGVVAFIGGLCWTELGLTFPKCGGEYILIKETLGPVMAFSMMLLRVIVVPPCAWCIGLLTLSSYFLAAIFPDCGDHEDLVVLARLIAASIGCILCILNCLNASWFARIQIVISSIKVLTLVILIITGVISLAQGNTDSLDNSFKDTISQIGMISLAIQSALWAYEGWDVLQDFTEEIKRPERNVPLAAIGGVATVIACYLLVNVAYLSVLTPQEVKDSPATAVIFGYQVYGPEVARIIPLFVAASVFGTVNGAVFTNGRVVFSAAREGHLPSFMAMIHRTKRTPIFTVVLQTFIGCMMLIPKASSIKSMMSLFTTAVWIVKLAVISGLLWTRYKRPNLHRPLKLPIVIPVGFLIIALFITIVPFFQTPFESSISVVLILCGLPVYYFVIHLKATPKWVLRCLDWIGYKTQLLLNVRYPTTMAEIGS